MLNASFFPGQFSEVIVKKLNSLAEEGVSIMYMFMVLNYALRNLPALIECSQAVIAPCVLCPSHLVCLCCHLSH